MIVVVGGSARNVGKTLAVCDLIAATREARWTAVKITPHQHEPSDAPNTDTARYLAAGAAEAHLFTPLQLPVAANLIIESNAVLDHIDPDLVIFVRGDGDWKASAKRVAERADFTIERVTPEVIQAVRARLSAPRS